MKKTILFVNLVLSSSSVLGMQNHDSKQDNSLSSSSYGLVSVENNSLSKKNNPKTKKDWMIQIIKMINNNDSNDMQTEEERTMLITATEQSDISIMQQILRAINKEGKQIIDVNARDKNKDTALSIAAKLGATAKEKIELLLNNGADLNLVKGIISDQEYGLVLNIANKLTKKADDLSKAVKKNNINSIKKLLRKGVDPDVLNSNKNTALIEATLLGYFDIVDLLIQNKANTNIRDEYGNTALILASENGCKDIVKLLLENGANPNIQNKNDSSALIFASQNGYLDIVRLLLKNKGNHKINDESRLKAFLSASAWGHLDIVKLLVNEVENLNVQNNKDQTALILASKAGRIDVVSWLVQEGADCNITDKLGENALMAALFNGHQNIAEFLFDKHANVGAGIVSAAVKKNINKVNWFLKKGADPNVQDELGSTALIEASMNGDINIVKLLLNNGADPNKLPDCGDTALMLASEHGHKDIVELLLEHDAKHEIPSKGGDTALMFASKNGHYSIVELLLKHGAKHEIQNSYGNTALMFASNNGHYSIVELLLKHGAKHEIQNAYGNTALMFASKKGHYRTVELLLSKGADPEIQNNEQDTALMFASRNGHKDIVELLLKHSVKFNIQNKDKDKALIVASKSGHLDIVRLLLDNGADINYINENNGCSSALYCSIVNDHEKIVKLLLSNEKLDVKCKYNDNITNLMIAVDRCNPSIVKMLLNHPEIDVEAKNDYGETALDMAKSYNQWKIQKLILSKLNNQKKEYKNKSEPLPNSIDVQDKSKRRQNNIMLQKHMINKQFLDLATSGDTQEIEKLLDKEDNEGKMFVDVTITNDLGRNALMIAAGLDDINMLLTLMPYMKEQLSNKDKKGDNALIIAANKGSFDIVEELLYRGLNINSTGYNKKTALMYAVERGDLRLFKLLMQKGAKASIRDNSNQTALDIAKRKSKEEQAKGNKKKEVYDNIIKTLEEIDSNVNEDNNIITENIEKKTWIVLPASNKYEADFEYWQKNNKENYKKISWLVEDIKNDPFRGIGRPERLKGDLIGLYSRKIDKENRIIYYVDGDNVKLLSCKGHYDNKDYLIQCKKAIENM